MNTDRVLAIREQILRDKQVHDQRAPFLDLVSIIIAGIPGAGLPQAAFDKLTAGLAPDLTTAVAGICDVVAVLSQSVDGLANDRVRIEELGRLIEANAALQDRIVNAASFIAHDTIEVQTTERATQSFHDVVFRNLALKVTAETGGKNKLSQVHQAGGGAAFVASGADSDNQVSQSTFSGDSSTVDVGLAHLRSVKLNTPSSAVEVTAGEEHSVGLMIGGDGKGAAMWIPGK